MAYRPPSRAPKGAWARHLHRVRQERALSQQQAFELVRDGLHLSPKSRAVYLAIDMGDRQPRPEEAEFLASLFGWPEPEPVAEVASDHAALIAALDRQSKAIEDLVQWLRMSVAGQVQAAERLGGIEGMLAEVRALVDTRTDTPPQTHGGAAGPAKARP